MSNNKRAPQAAAYREPDPAVIYRVYYKDFSGLDASESYDIDEPTLVARYQAVGMLALAAAPDDHFNLVNHDGI